MNELENALRKMIGDLPHQIIVDQIAKKLASHGIKLSGRKLKKLEDKILSGNPEPIILEWWRWWSRKQIVLEFTEKDAEEIEHNFDKFISDGFHRLYETIVEDVSTDLLSFLKRRWVSEDREQLREMAGFRHRLMQNWKAPLGLLRMLLTIAREFGSNINYGIRESPAADREHLIEALTRLHARSCQVMEEVICLLSTGLADGAMARWRTLHEIAVVALFISQHGEDVAERYLWHTEIESFRAAKEYQKCQDRLGYEPISAEELAELRKLYEEALKKFGPPFTSAYGWAAKHLNMSRPTFVDLERACSIDHLRAHYRMASHNVHANPMGVFFKLGLLGESQILLSGPSDIGLTDPGHGSAISLVQVSGALSILSHPTLDSILALQIMLKLTDEIGQKFIEAQQRIEKKHGHPG
jgi:hypothetical protein